jgi:PAS domain-containing protein
MTMTQATPRPGDQNDPSRSAAIGGGGTRRLTIDEALELAAIEPSPGGDHFRTIIDSMLDAVFLLSPVRERAGAIVDFRIDHANSAALQLMRGTFAEIVDHRLLDLAPAADDLVDHYERVLATGAAFRTEHVYEGQLTRSGEVQVPFEVSALRLDGGVVVCCRDMSQRQAAEDALRRSEERFRSLIQNSTDIILVIARSSGWMRSSAQVPITSAGG